MYQKGQLKDNADIKLIVEKNQEVIDAMTKLNELLDQESISTSQRDKKIINEKLDKPEVDH